jgi:hypothetical protein
VPGLKKRRLEEFGLCITMVSNQKCLRLIQWLNVPIGHGGFGYQSSYGCSLEVVKLADETLKEKARL